MSLLGGRSTSFSFGQQPSGFGASSGLGGGGQSSTPTGQSQQPGSTPSNSFSFGGSTGQIQQQPAGVQQQPQPAGGSSLFSFGQQQPQQQQPQQPQQQQQQPQQQQLGGGLFGGSQGTAGLFGQQQQPQQQGQSTGLGTSLFGQPPQQQNQQAGSSLFGGGAAQKPFSFGLGQTQPAGQQQAQPQQQQSFSFGATAPSQQQQQQQPSSLFGQQTQAGQAQQNQFSATAPASTGSSLQINPNSPFARHPYHQKERFNDLPDEHKKLFEEMDRHITGQLRIKDELMTRDYGSEIKKRIAEWNELHNGVSNTLLILQQDGELTKAIVDHVERDRTDLATLYEIARNFKEGKSDGKQWVNWPGEFFAKAAVEFRDRIKRYRSTIEEIEKQLATIDTRNEHSPQLISDAILHQHSIFMSLASNVANLHAEMEQLKRDYVQWYQQQYRSVRDPFAMSQLTSTI